MLATLVALACCSRTPEEVALAKKLDIFRSLKERNFDDPERTECMVESWIWHDDKCDDFTNIAACNFDGGACCLTPIHLHSSCNDCECKQ